MTNRLIKTEEDYEKALARIDQLMDAKPGTAEMDELELLTVLVALYEDRHFPINQPDPIEAIKFRMDQMGLTQKDMVPYIGSKSKVSEVLSGKRPLTLAMMRSLNTNLGIAAEVLLKAPSADFPEDGNDWQWEKFPVIEMSKRCWLPKIGNLKEHAEEVMRGFIAKAGGLEAVPTVLFRRTKGSRLNAKTDFYALTAWCIRILILARQNPIANNYKKGAIKQGTLHDITRLSYFENGPLLAKEYLEKQGIHLIVEPHLPKTYLDGAAMLMPDGTPVIGLTLRYDRIDNFWFCLLHELAHVAKHISPAARIIVDDLDFRGRTATTEDQAEREADEMAREGLIPKSFWSKNAITGHVTTEKVFAVAEKLKVHPAIIAGRIRYEQNNYRLLAKYVGNNQVRKQFIKVCQAD